MSYLALIQPGDCLLYGGSSLTDLIIEVKTWSIVAHVEIALDSGSSIASRNGIGVNKYAFRKEGLMFILRPKTTLRLDLGLRWFEDVAKGQAYDWLGLLCFTLAVKQGSPNKMFCSEFATNFYRACQLPIFNPYWPADKVSPGNLLTSPALDIIWPYSVDFKL